MDIDILEEKMIGVDAAIRICDDMIVRGADIYFDPDIYIGEMEVMRRARRGDGFYDNGQYR